MTSPIPLSAIGAASPTSRSTFRLLATSIGATNREADTLRQALLAQWAEHSGVDELVQRLQSLDRSDPDGALGVDARLAAWLTFAGPGGDLPVSDDDPALAGLPKQLRNRLAATTGSTPD